MFKKAILLSLKFLFKLIFLRLVNQMGCELFLRIIPHFYDLILFFRFYNVFLNQKLLNLSLNEKKLDIHTEVVF